MLCQTHQYVFIGPQCPLCQGQYNDGYSQQQNVTTEYYILCEKIDLLRTEINLAYNKIAKLLIEMGKK